jgi:hypothetical protein
MGRRLKCARCNCGRYTQKYAERLGHVCSDEPQVPAKGGRPFDEESRMVAIALRADGRKLREIGAALGVTAERARKLLATSGIPICRKCKRPAELRPRQRVCAECYAKAMRNRPSQLAKRTGYRTSRSAHRHAAAVRLAREGKTLTEIAESLGYTYQTVWDLFHRMRAAGRDIEVTRDKTGRPSSTA